MGTGGQGVGDGHSPRHQTLHRSGNPAGGDAHDARRESGKGQEMISGNYEELRNTVRLIFTFSIYFIKSMLLPLSS